ncbi:MAG TPA: hypothetical protein VE987_15375 [Polyangiaceae bacterium]|nr:hypothetical protein [Polyangiaceae bacterium]
MQRASPELATQRSDVRDVSVRPGRTTAELAGGRRQNLTALGGRLRTWGGRLIDAALTRTTDAQLAALLALGLLALAAWPLALVDLPPLQDLPNHLAAVSVIEHPERYPEFAYNGLFKTNAALFAWLLGVGRLVGARQAARLFVLVVLGLGAFALPRFALSFGGRRRMVVSAFFCWPLVHNWFVSMGMLDFALGFALAVLLLVLLNGQRVRPGAWRAFGVALLALATWYAHVFPLLVVYLLVVVHVASRSTWPLRRSEASALLAPLAPSAALAAWSLWLHWTEPVRAMTAGVALGRFLPPWELVYNLWAEWFYGFTWLEIATIVPCVAMGLWALSRCREKAALFGPAAFSALGALYFFSPYVATNWFHVGSRIIPFLWLAALVRLPEALPGRVLAALGACAVSYSIGMGVDYVRLDRDAAAFTAGMSAVPDGARLLPLVFRSKKTSENTRSLLHAWAFYAIEKRTSAPLLFAHSRSFAVTYREPPIAQFNHLVLEGFAPSMASPDWLCTTLRSGGLAVDDCADAWRAKWAAFWRLAEPSFDHVLMWAAPAQVIALVPRDYRLVFRRDELAIFARTGAREASGPEQRAP